MKKSVTKQDVNTYTTYTDIHRQEFVKTSRNVSHRGMDIVQFDKHGIDNRN